MKKIIFTLFLLFPLIIQAQSRSIISESQVVNDLLTKDVMDLSFQSPLILKDSIIFFYYGSAQSVEIAGEFNEWQIQKMEESRSNLWVLLIKNRLDKGQYKYRIRVNGLWIADPLNPQFEYDMGRQKISLLKLPTDFLPNKQYPFWLSNNTYIFQYQSTNASVVTLAGDFNNWNPYSHQLKYKGAGIFEIEIHLTAKKIYLYSFVEDGKWVGDVFNKKQFVSDINRPTSAFYADQENSIP